MTSTTAVRKSKTSNKLAGKRKAKHSDHNGGKNQKLTDLFPNKITLSKSDIDHEPQGSFDSEIPPPRDEQLPASDDQTDSERKRVTVRPIKRRLSSIDDVMEISSEDEDHEGTRDTEFTEEQLETMAAKDYSVREQFSTMFYCSFLNS